MVTLSKPCLGRTLQMPRDPEEELEFRIAPIKQFFNSKGCCRIVGMLLVRQVVQQTLSKDVFDHI